MSAFMIDPSTIFAEVIVLSATPPTYCDASMAEAAAAAAESAAASAFSVATVAAEPDTEAYAWASAISGNAGIGTTSCFDPTS